MAKKQVYVCDRCQVLVDKATTIRVPSYRASDGVEMVQHYASLDICNDCCGDTLQSLLKLCCKLDAKQALEWIRKLGAL